MNQCSLAYQRHGIGEVYFTSNHLVEMESRAILRNDGIFAH